MTTRSPSCQEAGRENEGGDGVREPTQARSRERVDAIIAAFSGLLAERSFNDVTVRDIAAAAAVPNGTIYQFFDGKEDVMTALASRVAAEVDFVTREVLDPATFGAAPGDAIVSLLARLDDVQSRHGGFVCLARTDPADGRVGELAERLRNSVRKRLERAVATSRPTLRAARRKIVLTVLSASMLNALTELPPRGSPSRKAYLDEVSRLLKGYTDDALGSPASIRQR
jgi:AcrR family transcriptional regulator